jgi:hypothetical protein
MDDRHIRFGVYAEGERKAGKKEKGVGKLNAIVAWGETVKKGIEW